MREGVGTSFHAGFLFIILGAAAWVTGQPFIFPSLGPSAFVLAFERRDRGRAYRVVVSHAIGGVAGLGAYIIFASGIAITEPIVPLSFEGLRLAMSATVSVIMTSWGMIASDSVHAPACATTLIVSLGLLSTPIQVAIILVSVVSLVGIHRGSTLVYERIADDGNPD